MFAEVVDVANTDSIAYVESAFPLLSPKFAEPPRIFAFEGTSSNPPAWAAHTTMATAVDVGLGGRRPGLGGGHGLEEGCDVKDDQR